MQPPALHVVWFKRDLRVVDHAPLAAAAARGAVLPLYVVEPELWQQADASGRQWLALREALIELREALAALGQPLVVRHGEIIEVLGSLAQRHDIAALYSHQETGNDWTYQRDRRLAAWLRERGIVWREYRQFGVIRGLRRRQRWASRWEALIGQPIRATPNGLRPLQGIEAGEIPDWPTPQLPADSCPGRQRGGRRQALALLDSFLVQRGLRYHRQMSSPLSAAQSCSRLSLHLAHGSLSLREVVHASRARREALRALPAAERGESLRALAAFESRLHWHCHFIQKLESEPEIEFRNIHRGYDGMREPHFDRERFAAWSQAATGWPFVDACLVALRETGWINFRMRAMLVSVAAYHYWLHWREPALQLARWFTDYEPGIHYSQCQMQSGVTGINIPRIYNPIKQSQDQDPNGLFIRRWLPQLAGVPDAWIHTPWKMDTGRQARYGCRIGRDYPAPLTDHEAAAREARQRLGQWRRRPGMRALGLEVMARHGSRKRRLPADRPAAPVLQGELF